MYICTQNVQMSSVSALVHEFKHILSSAIFPKVGGGLSANVFVVHYC